MLLMLTSRPWKRTRRIAEPVESALADPARQQLVSQILEFNPSASQAFLGSFESSALRTYLDHLQAAQVPRGRSARWERPGDSPPIMCRERAD